VRPFFYYGQTELSRICIGVEFIGGGGKYGLMISLFWWFLLFGLERTAASRVTDA